MHTFITRHAPHTWHTVACHASSAVEARSDTAAPGTLVTSRRAVGSLSARGAEPRVHAASRAVVGPSGCSYWHCSRVTAPSASEEDRAAVT